MDLGLQGKVAAVAGSSSGLGRAVALALAGEGAHLGICARGQERLGAARESIRAATGAPVLAVQADLTRPDEIERFVGAVVGEFGGLDILVTNAGGPPKGMFDQMTDADWAQGFELTLMSSVRLARAAIPHLKRGGAGRIINIASVSVRQPIAGLLLSNSLRLAVVGLAKTLSNELAPHRITVNTMAVGWTDTELVAHSMAQRASEAGLPVEEVLRPLVADIPLGRLARPEEVGALAAFLASRWGAFITGSTILIDGGNYKGAL